MVDKKSSGFTLVEVLIAAFIMFIALATFTSVFRGALIASERASDNLKHHALISLVMEKVHLRLLSAHSQSEASGEERLMGQAYSWQAEVVDFAHPPARYFGDELIQPEHVAKLWRVTFTADGEKQPLSYTEITW